VSVALIADGSCRGQACRLSKAREMKEKELVDMAALNERREQLHRRSAQVINECLQRFRCAAHT
jgi:hypothetical protein